MGRIQEIGDRTPFSTEVRVVDQTKFATWRTKPCQCRVKCAGRQSAPDDNERNGLRLPICLVQPLTYLENTANRKGSLRRGWRIDAYKNQVTFEHPRRNTVDRADTSPQPSAAN